MKSVPQGLIIESEDVQFGEPAISAMAMGFSDFVPMYRRLLFCWDLDHAVHPLESTIDRIAAQHANLPETRELVEIKEHVG